MKVSRIGFFSAGILAPFIFAFGFFFHTQHSGLLETASAQAICTEPRPDPANPPRRTAGSTITLKIHSEFTDQEEASIKQAFRDWNAKSELNCTNLYFDVDNAQILDEQPPSQPNSQWVGYDPTTEGAVAISYLNSTQFGRIYLSGRIRLCNPNVCPSFVLTVTRHEIGHSLGLQNSTCSSPAPSIMCSPTTPGNDITSCDTQVIRSIYCPAPTPNPTPTPMYGYCFPEDAGDCPNWQAYCSCSFQEMGWWTQDDCNCNYYTPIVIDINGDGFSLTNAVNGVDFDLNANGAAEHISSWTSTNTDEAWLVLDRNGNGTIDNGAELFGNVTPQPEPPPGVVRNGFLALAEYDKLFNGGNNDGFINRRDVIFDSLRLWQDVNHNGVSEPSELFTLPQLGIELDYRESRRTDEHGNRFAFRARVRDANDAQLGRWAWDVYLLKYTPPNQ